MKFESEQEAIEALSEGNHDAFYYFYEQYFDKVHEVGTLYLKKPHLIDDLIQDVFTTIWAERHKLNGVREFKAFLFIVARNKAINSLKKIAREYNRVQEAAKDSVEIVNNNVDDIFNNLEMDSKKGLLKRAAENLPEGQKKIFQLASENGGLEIDVIAKQLGRSPRTVRNQLLRAVKSIKGALVGQPQSL
jgi:RNA polymerase sigma factor (sigma-70 family)